MRNRNWDRDFEEINQSDVNRFHTTRSGERQYDSGYSNPYGQTTYEQHMSQRDQGQPNHHDNPDNRQGNWVNKSEDRYNPYHQQSNRAGQYGHARVDYDERMHLHHRHPDQNANDRGFFGNIGNRVGEFIHEGRERIEQVFDRFGNNHPQQSGPDERGNWHRPMNRDWNPKGHRHGNQGNRWHNQMPRPGYENSPYHPNNQGQVQGNRYNANDYSGRSSYRLLDTYSGYGQSGLSYASDRDDE